MDGMTYDEALAWLRSKDSPGGPRNNLPAKRILSDAIIRPTHVTLGLDVAAPGIVLMRGGAGFLALTPEPRLTTPFNVQLSLTSERVPVAARGRRGWVTFWDTAPEAVRVEYHGVTRDMMSRVRRVLERHLWKVEVLETPSAAWLRVTQEPEHG